MTTPQEISDKELVVQFQNALARFRELGLAAEPVVFGPSSNPEAVLIPYALYEEVNEMFEDMMDAPMIRERIAQGGGKPLSALAESLGLNPSDYE